MKNITVKELIEMLKEFDQDAVVCVSEDYYDTYNPIDRSEIVEITNVQYLTNINDSGYGELTTGDVVVISLY